jgi:two-component system cell cycle response regulator CpdR
MIGKRVLVVDDERTIADTLVRILNQSGFRSSAAYDGSSALDHLQSGCPEILLSDVILPGMSGVEIAKRAVAQCPEMKVFFISGQAASLDILSKAKKSGLDFELFAKPTDPEELIQALLKSGTS